MEMKLSDEARILVIDDEEVIHASMARVLSRAGYDVVSVFQAHDGIDRLRAEHFDLLITDLKMPEMTGIELLDELEHSDIQVPAIIVTGYPTIQTAIEAMRLGAIDYLPKPYTKRELLAPVKRALKCAQVCDPIVDSGSLPVADIDTLSTGNVVFLPSHTWARLLSDGTFEIGVEENFLRCVGETPAISSAPRRGELVYRCTSTIKITNEQGEEHDAAFPLSGVVESINSDLLSNASRLHSDVWVVRLAPNRLKTEVSDLPVRMSTIPNE